MANLWYRGTEIRPTHHRDRDQDQDEEQEGEENKGMRIRGGGQGPAASLFCSIAFADIAQQQKQGSKRRPPADLLLLFPDCATLWSEILLVLLRGKTTKKLLLKEGCKPNIADCYPRLCELFTQLVGRLSNDLDNEEYTRRTFGEDLLFASILGLDHAHGLLEPNIFTTTKADTHGIEVELSRLKMFNEFFFILARVKCNTMLHERHLSTLQATLSRFLSCIQKYIQSMPAGAPVTGSVAEKPSVLASYLYYVLQTIVAMAIFGEPIALSKRKYLYIAEFFKSLFALSLHSTIFEQVLNQLHAFEDQWQEREGAKRVLQSWGQKRLSLSVMKSKLSKEEPVRVSLKYVLLCYNYKIMKLMAQRLKPTYDEQLLSMLYAFLQKNHECLQIYIALKNNVHAMDIMLLLNEDAVMLKSFLLDLSCYTGGTDAIPLQSSYAMIKESAVNCLTLAMKSGMSFTPERKEDLENTRIYFPRDLLALLFKSLLHFRIAEEQLVSAKHKQEMLKHLNKLLTTLLSRSNSADVSTPCSMYKLYLLQFMNQWQASELKERASKYIEEISRVVNESAFVPQDPLTAKLQEHVLALALNLLIKLATVENALVLATTMSSIKDSSTNYSLLFEWCYILACLLCLKRIPKIHFEQALAGNVALIQETFGVITASPLVQGFTQLGGINTLLEIYKRTLAYITQVRPSQTPRVLNSDQAKGSQVDDNDSTLSQAYFRRVDATIAEYKSIAQVTGGLICGLLFALPIAEHALGELAFDAEYCALVLCATDGLHFTLRLLDILGAHVITVLHTSDHLEKYVTLPISILSQLRNAGLSPAQEKEFIILLMIQYGRLIPDHVHSASHLIVPRGE